VPWLLVALGWGAVLSVAWMAWETTGLDPRVVRDTLVFVVGPGALGVRYGEHLGWRVDRRAVRNAVLLAAFVLPFYLVGSSLPSVRAFYPMWGATLAPSSFVPHVLKQFLLVLAAETYYRGLLCVGVREYGFKVVFISPVVYALHHAGKPPVEILLSGPTDVLFGAADYESNSLLPSVVAHGAGLALLDWLVLHPPLVDPDAVVRWLSWLPVPL
jgi:hypothetical protein